jgi:phage baseplate assembly protein W
MQLEFYTLPLAVENIMHKQELPRCSLQQSVLQHLHLLLTTSFGEFPADEIFGCGVWDHDFDIVTSAHKLKELIRVSLLNSINDQEKRLGNVRVEIVMKQEEIPAATAGRRVKKKIDITITGILKLTNEKFGYRDSFFVGPLSY